MTISLEQAQTVVAAALAHGTEQGFNPLTVAVLDPGGAIVALARQDGSGNLRPDLAVAKAYGVLALGMTNRAIAARAADSPEFFTSVAALAGGKILSVPGGVFVRDADGRAARRRRRHRRRVAERRGGRGRRDRGGRPRPRHRRGELTRSAPEPPRRRTPCGRRSAPGPTPGRTAGRTTGPARGSRRRPSRSRSPSPARRSASPRPRGPTICAPSSRPVRCSAISLSRIGAAPGK